MSNGNKISTEVNMKRAATGNPKQERARRRGITARFPATVEVNFTSQSALQRFVSKATFNTGIITRTDDGTVVQVTL